jgi:hypothetical protein
MPGPASPEPPPALVSVTVWGVPARGVPAAMLRVGLAGRSLRQVPGLRFAKLLGTADGRTFAARDTDLRHWALVAAWDSVDIAEDLASTAPGRQWAAAADETLHVRLRPLASRGSWSGRTPFTPLGDVAGASRDAVGTSRPDGVAPDRPVAALTRARVRPSMWRRFASAVPPVAHDLQGREGVRLALGIGEAPIGYQGTFSVWSSAAALRQFAYTDPKHAAAIEDTDRLGWYAEELFARFEVLSTSGTYRGRTVDVGTDAS